jgi:peptidoglycan/xylan/chitin deacetylase (PgdA/CDA1 family)
LETSLIWITLGILALIEILGFLLWYVCSVPSSQVLGPALVRGPSADRCVALTFDDGPASSSTPQILDILRERQVRATFFVCGANAQRYPDLLLRMHLEGHTIGNHTYSHPYLYFLSPKQMAEEIDRTQKVIQEATGQPAVHFRPPYGARWFGIHGVLRQRGIQMVQWSNNPRDWEDSAEQIVERTLRSLKPGDIILLHDGWQRGGGYLKRIFWRSPQISKPRTPELPTGTMREEEHSNTVQALSAIIEGVRNAGYAFVPVQEFLSQIQEDRKHVRVLW